MKIINKEESKKILIETKPFGKIEISSKEIISFPEGIFAFEGLKEYVLLSTKKQLSFRWLQSLEEKNITFLMANPVEFLPNYSPKISKENLEIIQTSESSETSLFCIVTIPANQPKKMTINLQGPIIINFNKMLAAQFVSEDASHQVRQSFFELLTQENKV